MQPNHVGQFARLLDRRRALGQPPAAKQTEQVEFALGAHLLERLVVRKIDDLNHETLAEASERGWQPVERGLGESVNVL